MAHIPMTPISGRFSAGWDQPQDKPIKITVDRAQLQSLGRRGVALRLALEIMQDLNMEPEHALFCLAAEFLGVVGN